jgi:translation initiation factor eIF-2B subunit epsilon
MYSDLSSAAVFAIDAKTNECVHLETLDAFPRKNQIAIDRELFKKHPEIDLRNDLIDCQIDICTPEVSLKWILAMCVLIWI